MKCAVVLFFVALSSQAQEHCGSLMLAIDGGGRTGTKADALAIGWKLPQPYRNVTIAVRLDSGGYDDYSIGSAYLMRQVGPGTTRYAEVSASDFELPPAYEGELTLFHDLDLTPGEYWIVFERPSYAKRGEPEWGVGKLQDLTVANGILFLGTKAYSYVNHRARYLPDASFMTTDGLQGYPLLIKGIPIF